MGFICNSASGFFNAAHRDGVRLWLFGIFFSESLAQLVLAVAQVVNPQVSLSETIKVIVSTVSSAQKLARVTLCTRKVR
jgi:hypothetical protein